MAQAGREGRAQPEKVPKEGIPERIIFTMKTLVSLEIERCRTKERQWLSIIVTANTAKHSWFSLYHYVLQCMIEFSGSSYFCCFFRGFLWLGTAPSPRPGWALSENW